MVDLTENVSRKIRISRIMKGMTIEQLSALTGLSTTTISWLENRKLESVRELTLIKISQALDINYNDFFKEDKE